jgi:chemotaxis protein MotB
MSGHGGDWRSPGGVGKHGAWKVAYADFITALMAVFLVMWLTTQKQEVRAAVAGYFRDSGGNSGGRSVLTGGGSSIPSISQVQASLERAATRIRDAMAQSPEFAKLRDQVEIQVTSEGLRIELVDSAQTGFFASGSARMEPETVQLLAAIGKELSQITQGGIIVEGHTDRQPYRQDGYGNWELSTDRANMARRVMQASGLTDARLSAVRGFADTRLRVPEDPLDPRNRRVSVVVPVEAEPRLLQLQPVTGRR